MSWIQKLYETYDACAGNESIPDIEELCPVGYSVQNAHIEVVVNQEGNFKRASLVQKDNNPKTLIPVTEKSLTGRTSSIAPHPLCDSLQYCAGDYEHYGDRKPYFNSYFNSLESWNESGLSHEKVNAVYKYVLKRTLVKDLINLDLLFVKDGMLAVVEKTNDKEKVKVSAPNTDSPIIMDTKELHPIMKLLTMDDKGIKNQAKVFIRWNVETVDSLCSETWKDKTLIEKWAEYSSTFDSLKGFCCVTGEKDCDISQKHPAKLRNGKDGAKLISSNDTSGFTFLGRFKSVNEAASVSSVVTQKAHSALRWLIGRKQAFRSGDQVFVSWATSGKQIPSPCDNSWDFLGDDFQSTDTSASKIGDVGQSFALRFSKKLAGYKTNISDTENIVVMGLDSATPGRMAITFYRELSGSEFLECIEKWHSDYAWFQNYGKDKNDKKKMIYFKGAPAPRDIAWCAYGSKVEGKNGTKLLNSTVERLLPSIIDGRPVPRDLVEQCVRRTSNRSGLEPWEFKKCLGIACSLFRGFYNERGYTMALEDERNTRDYLYGRLLAVADQIESKALQLAKENRGTTASRLMQRFSDRPFSTWKNIEEALKPYKERIRSKYPGLLHGYDELLDIIHSMIVAENYVSDTRLTGEYLLGYHCQKQWFRDHKRDKGQWVLKSTEDIDNQDMDDEE